MGVLGIILLCAFIIVCLLLVAIVLLQNEEGDGLGGLLGGASNVAFGSRAGNVLTRTTYVLVTLFFALSIGLALLNKAPSVDAKGLEDAARAQDASGTESEYWLEETSADNPAPSLLESADTDF